MTTSSSFGDGDEDDSHGDRRWEDDVVGGLIEEDGDDKYILVDRFFEDGYIKSDKSIRLDKVE